MPSFLYSQLLTTLPKPTGSYKGQTVIVTGSNVGLGKEAARHFTRLGASKVILAVRSASKGEAAKLDIEKSTGVTNVVEVWDLDMASYESVLNFAARAERELARLDIAVLNAGVVRGEWEVFEQDESTLTVNVVCTFLLAMALVPKLKETAIKFNKRPNLTIVSSEVHAWCKFEERKAPDGKIFEELNKKPEQMPVEERYQVSKLLEVLVVRALTERKSAQHTPITPRLRKETGNTLLRSKLDTGLNAAQLFRRAIIRPTKMLFLSPICFLMSLYMSIVYAFLYLLFTTFTFVFEDQYGFSPSIVGLVYIGMGVGNFIGLGLLGVLSDRIAKRLAAKDGGQLKPEYRLPPLLYGGPCIPVGLFLYGWTAQYQVHWIVPIIGTVFVGIGLIACFMCINTYLVDTFTLYAASAMAANTVLRSIFGGAFPLFGLQMYDSLGLGWGNSLLAFIGVALLPIPWVFYTYGERIRTHPRFQIQF